MRHLTSVSSLTLLVAVSVLWLLGKGLSFASPITAAKIVDLLLFVLLLVWFLYAVVGLIR